MNKKAFTLLELLVVVLIIGILAAIALPKYQLTVDKSTFIKLQSIAVSLRDAYNEYILIHGNGTTNFEDLSITLPNDFQNSYSEVNYNCVSNNDMYCCLSASGTSHVAAIMCGKKDLSFIYAENFLSKSGGATKRNDKCKAAKDNTRAHRLCSAIGEQSGDADSSNAWTPQGTKSKYTNYLLN